MKIRTIPTLFTLLITLFSIFSLNTLLAQEVEVQGSLKVTQMDADESGEELVIRNADGSLGTRSVATLPAPPPPIDTSRNLASDFELAKFLCECPNMPPFMIRKLIESGYTAEDLIEAGIPAEDVIDVQRGGVFIDTRDNQSYKTVQIGDQVWMAENLNFGTLIDSTSIPMDNSIIEKYCYNDDPANCEIYGGLYRWDEMMQYTTIESGQGICPTGWHVPSDDEWKILEIELGMTLTEAHTNVAYRGTDQGSKIGGNQVLWMDGKLAQNGVFESSGFMALPGGYFNPAFFWGRYTDNYFWSSSESSASFAYWRSLGFDNTEIWRGENNKLWGQSIRCVKD